MLNRPNDFILKDHADKIGVLSAQLQQKATVTQVEQKRDKSVLIEMSDLSQDVKTGMTGGSVAVVGVGSVNNVNVNKNQITLDKLADTIAINVTDLPIKHSGKYIDNAGVLVDGAGWNVREYVVPDESRSVVLSGTSDVVYKGVAVYSDRTIALTLNKSFYNHSLSLLINEQTGQTYGIRTITVNFFKKGFINSTQFDVLSKEEIVENGYIKGNVVTFSEAFSHYKIPIKTGYKYKVSLTAVGGYYGCMYDVSDNFLSDITLSGGYVNIPANASYMKINISANDTVYEEKDTVTSGTVTSTTQIYSHCVNRPYAFSGKTALFFGDSITQGYTNGSIISPNGYPKLFSDKVGMTFTNKGVGGALFTAGYNSVETIPITIQNTVLNSDYVFIAGGTNDFGLGATLTEFETAISDLCAYLKANYTGQVIFITPINRVTPSNNEVAPLQTYRNIITEYALKNGYSVVAGNECPFPLQSGSYQAAVMPDNLHPSELGYQVYAKSLTTVLC